MPVGPVLQPVQVPLDGCSLLKYVDSVWCHLPTQIELPPPADKSQDKLFQYPTCYGPTAIAYLTQSAFYPCGIHYGIATSFTCRMEEGNGWLKGK